MTRVCGTRTPWNLAVGRWHRCCIPASVPLQRLEPRGPEIDDAELSELERLIGARLPLDYRGFLLEWNGGVPIPDAYQFGGVTTLISRFYSVNATNVLHDLATRYVALRTRVPHNLLPVATDLATNLICLGIAGERTGHIYYMSLQREAELAARRPQPIALSFALFVRGLFAMTGGHA